MGLLTAYVAYKSGKKRATKNLPITPAELDELTEICSTCGHMRMQHSHDDRALCPRYDY